ncbi:MAG: hypothetical protein J0M29_04630 [Chitinophagales bacterium]|nr:hypothetical protein [Chitinophagales bacterium]
MKSLFRILFCLLICMPVMVKAQAPKTEEIQVFPAVLKTAEWANFKYMDVLEKAKGGDHKAIRSFLEFSGTVDGTEALQHATTCIELLPFLSDEIVGSIIYSMKPKLKSVLLSRFQLAQGRTKKEALLKPMQEWAPLTWKALNGERVVCTSCMHEGGLAPAKPGFGIKPDASGTAAPASQEETGKQ